jgi:hypothetical protein
MFNALTGMLLAALNIAFIIVVITWLILHHGTIGGRHETNPTP